LVIRRAPPVDRPDDEPKNTYTAPAWLVPFTVSSSAETAASTIPSPLKSPGVAAARIRWWAWSPACAGGAGIARSGTNADTRTVANRIRTMGPPVRGGVAGQARPRPGCRQRNLAGRARRSADRGGYATA